MTGATLRATTETGQTWDDPSEDLLFELLSDIEDGDEAFVIVERLGDPTGQTYAQATLADDRWLVEHRDGSAAQHFQTVAADKHESNRILTAWAFELDDWRTAIPWERVEV